MKKILETDLILQKGKAYHLNLFPEDIPDLVFTVGDPERVSAVSRYFDRVTKKISNREFVSHMGKLNNTPAMVLSTGIGTDNIDIVLNELDALVNIDFKTKQIRKTKRRLTIIRIGTSGTIQKDIPIDSFLVSDGAIGLDALMNFYQSYKIRVPEQIISQSDLKSKFVFKNGYWSEADKKLIERFEDYFHGITLTAPGFYGPQGRTLRLKSSHFDMNLFSRIVYRGLKITNIEMETAGIYSMASALGHKAISCNAILANRIDNTFSPNPSKTIERLIQSVINKF